MKRTTAFLVFALMMSVMAFAAPDVLQVETVEETAVEINIEESAELAADYGYCGDNLTWTLDDEGTLTISGSGEMYDYIDSYRECVLSNASVVLIPNNENDGIERYEEWMLSDGSVVLMPIYENPDEDLQYMEKRLSDGSVVLVDNKTSYKELTLSDGSVVLVVDDGTEWVEYACSDGSIVLIDPNQTYAEFHLSDGSCVVVQNCVPWMQSKNEIKKIVVGKDVTILDPSVWLTECSNLTEFRIDAENGNYKTLDNILYKGNFEHLLKCPRLNPTNKVVVPEGVKTIGDNAFYWTENVSEVIIPDSVTSIGVSAFEESKVEKVSFGENSALTSIGESVFRGSLITSIEIPSKVKNIGDVAFEDCNCLESVIFEDNSVLTSIGNVTFWNCKALEAVYITDLAAWCGTAFGEGEWAYLNSNPLYYAGNLYINGVLATDVSIPNGVTKISDFAFSGCTSIESIEIPESVRSIGKMAFYECENLESIEILGDVVSIGENAFECTAFIENPDNYDDGVMYIGNSLIRADRYSLSGVYKIKEGTTCISPHAFAYCENLKVVDIPDSVVYIGDCAFACTGIVSVDIPAGVVSIGKGAFIECGDLVSVTFDKESKLEIIDDETFYRCFSLESIVIPKSVTSIGDGAFAYCYLKDIVIPENVTSIGDRAFEHCGWLKSIEIPESVTSIGDWAFCYCGGLEKVTIYGMDVTFGAAAFGFYNERQTFYGYEGSTVETYASENNISFEIMLKPGDINGTGEPDGEDVLDLAVVIAFDGLENLSEKQRDAANLYTDDDGENGEPVINIKDLIKLVQMMAENR